MLLLAFGPCVLGLLALALAALASKWPGPVEYPKLYLIYSSRRAPDVVED